jgi:ATP-dependent helicase/nuclease subunit A
MSSDTEDDDTPDDIPDNTRAEARMIAATIKDLQQKHGYKFEDFVILTRSISAVAADAVDELTACGIPAVADLSQDFFSRQEVKTALAMLAVIDNPRQDIPLLTVLASPVYALSADTLYEISTFHGEDFYDKVIASGLAPRFIADLADFRGRAATMSASALVGYVLDTTRYPSYVGSLPEGALCQANLRLLLQHAFAFENTGAGGLFRFLRHMARLQEVGKTEAARDKPPAGCVRLMTIHNSKGLEFPVVICAFLARKFNRDDMRRSVILHPRLGAGPYYVDTIRRTRANTLARYSLSRLLHRESASEEMRCLYVAMTRAEDMFVLSIRTPNYEKAREKWEATDISVPAIRRDAACYADWIMPCVLAQPNDFDISIHTKPAQTHEKAHKPSPPAPNINKAPPPTAKLQIPSKLSITEIRRLYDISPYSTVFGGVAVLEPRFDAPAFLRDGAPPTGAAIGSALHAVMEHINFHAHTTADKIAALVQQLIAKNHIPPEDAAEVDVEKILQFVRSDIGERLRTADAVHRETPFVLQLPACDIYAGLPPEAAHETILIHGIIDCFFIENGQTTLLDFKSDAAARKMPEAEWAAKHSTQMRIYARALSEERGTQVAEGLLYSFALGRAIPVANLNALTPSRSWDGT